ncbi:MAG: TrbG/VirB9 family P-type conjugative transfer protein [Deltaproteobacteria bacterium]|nr:TrbG/VirB9 family P-type conjugative transfer protein [Deltaproteobacteria bacterium]
MKWLVFIMTLLAFCVLSRALHAKEPRALTLAESDVAPIRTALGFTTMLTFDARPSSVILGDQDAFKVEYAGNGLALKPVVSHAKTNLFVFTDYDRFSFRLLVGPQGEADYAIRVKGKRAQSYSGDAVGSGVAPPALVERRLGQGKVCGGYRLVVESIGWPRSGSTYLVRFRVGSVRAGIPANGQPFEPGDFDIAQDGRSLPIENLYLEGLAFTKQTPRLRGTLVLRQAAIKSGQPLILTFSPDFLKKQNRCLSVAFSRHITARAKKKS